MRFLVKKTPAPKFVGHTVYLTPTVQTQEVIDILMTCNKLFELRMSFIEPKFSKKILSPSGGMLSKLNAVVVEYIEKKLFKLIGGALKNVSIPMISIGSENLFGVGDLLLILPAMRNAGHVRISCDRIVDEVFVVLRLDEFRQKGSLVISKFMDMYRKQSRSKSIFAFFYANGRILNQRPGIDFQVPSILECYERMEDS